jgi:hypothetical protein
MKLIEIGQQLRAAGMVAGAELASLFAGELNPVAPKAQKKVKVLGFPCFAHIYWLVMNNQIGFVLSFVVHLGIGICLP